MTSLTHDLSEAAEWLEWSSNPFGRRDVDLSQIPQYAHPLRCEGEIRGCGVGWPEKQPTPRSKRAILALINASLRTTADFPARIIGYYEGPASDDVGEGYRIEVYGEGPPPERLPEPPRPSWIAPLQ